MKFCRLMKYDFVNGIWKRGHIYLLMALMGSAFFFDFWLRIAGDMEQLEHIGEYPTLANVLIYIFQGDKPFQADQENAFIFPVVWLLVYLYTSFMALDYPYRNLVKNGTQVLVRVKSRNIWWFSKCCWVFFSTIICFILLYLVVLVGSLFCGMEISLDYADYINRVIWDMALSSPGSRQLFLMLFLLPAMTALALNLIQLCLGLFLDRVYCYIVTVVVLFVSAYFLTPIAIGNFAMVKRSIYVEADGVVPWHGLLMNGILAVLAIGIGFVRVQKFDILKKSR